MSADHWAVQSVEQDIRAAGLNLRTLTGECWLWRAILDAWVSAMRSSDPEPSLCEMRCVYQMNDSTFTSGRIEVCQPRPLPRPVARSL